MRSLYKISLAILAVGALVAMTGFAYADDMAKPTFTITGDAGSAFGLYSYDKATAASGAFTNTKAYSEYVTSWESNVRMTWSTDQFTSIVRYRIRGSNEGSGASSGTYGSNPMQSGTAFASASNDVYGETWWTPGAFKLGIGKFQGQAWSQPLSGTYVIINPLEVAGGASEYWMNWTGISGLDAEYNAGIVQVGVALSSQCKPSCNAGATNVISAPATTNVYDNSSTIVPHITGAVGDISFRAQLPQTNATVNSGTTTASGKTVTGSGLQAGVKWNGPAGLGVAVDYSSFDDAKVDLSTVGGAAEIKDRQRSSVNVRVDLPAGPGSLTAAYLSYSDNISANGVDTAYKAVTATNSGGANTYTSSLLTVRYNYPVTFGWVIPEFRAGTVGGGQAVSSGTKQKDLSDSEFRLIMQGRF